MDLIACYQSLREGAILIQGLSADDEHPTVDGDPPLSKRLSGAVSHQMIHDTRADSEGGTFCLPTLPPSGLHLLLRVDNYVPSSGQLVLCDYIRPGCTQDVAVLIGRELVVASPYDVRPHSSQT
ncbi:hypothetical protein MJO28_002241 [Puccinia striiformis f. sp. tritici]|uniref:Uncharacterized protein n=1 Tax=Puccinia striiformis f. sp. tritici TaxID=168172 RepID=A0ACC0EWK5_9BASI|nr:hypothetical protein MJO28_002241 [Puccinia striiformis f. sp. tritici]KAI7966575.1 hypothetical protein MJO29_002323 [Puccinia striiformis f. sp. tritici]